MALGTFPNLSPQQREAGSFKPVTARADIVSATLTRFTFIFHAPLPQQQQDSSRKGVIVGANALRRAQILQGRGAHTAWRPEPQSDTGLHSFCLRIPTSRETASRTPTVWVQLPPQAPFRGNSSTAEQPADPRRRRCNSFIPYHVPNKEETAVAVAQESESLAVNQEIRVQIPTATPFTKPPPTCARCQSSRGGGLQIRSYPVQDRARAPLLKGAIVQ